MNIIQNRNQIYLENISPSVSADEEDEDVMMYWNRFVNIKMYTAYLIYEGATKYALFNTILIL